MHSSLVIAEYLRRKGDGVDAPLTPMQLIKLVYLCHGWMLGLHGRRLINEDVEAWRYGPVIGALYDEVKHFRGRPVERPLADPTAVDKIEAEEKNIIDQVFNIYGKYTGIDLSKLTHASGTPWSEIRRAGRSGWEVIPNDLVTKHFRALAE